MQDFRNLKVWEKSHQLTLSIYKISANFPKTEIYGLTNQVRRAASSIPANIAEGCGRGSDPDFARFLQIAFGSANELEYHLLLARDLTYLSQDDYQIFNDEITQIQKMLTSLIKKLRTNR